MSAVCWQRTERGGTELLSQSLGSTRCLSVPLSATLQQQQQQQQQRTHQSTKQARAILQSHRAPPTRAHLDQTAGVEARHTKGRKKKRKKNKTKKRKNRVTFVIVHILDHQHTLSNVVQRSSDRTVVPPAFAAFLFLAACFSKYNLNMFGCVCCVWIMLEHRFFSGGILSNRAFSRGLFRFLGLLLLLLAHHSHTFTRGGSAARCTRVAIEITLRHRLLTHSSSESKTATRSGRRLKSK